MTTRVDFYLLSAAASQDAVLSFACRLVDKALQLGHRVYVYTASAEQTARLDDLLWTFRQDSFVPHAPYDNPLAAQAPVVLGHVAPPPHWTDLLVNLTPTLPPHYERFARIGEVVNHEFRIDARGRYQHYKTLGYGLEHHNVPG
jgi:DNA polymerase-3 subunit chi